MALWLGIVLSHMVGVAIFGIGARLGVRPNGPNEGGYLITEIVLTPIIIGIISGMVWSHAHPSNKERFAWTVVCVSVGLIGACAFVGEGTICVLIASPLILLLELIGVWVGSTLSNKRNDRLTISIVPLALAIFAHDAYAPQIYPSSVTDSIVINAPPSRIWPKLASFSKINEPSHFWIFDMGLPMPMQSVADAPVAGSSRKCIFSQDKIFEEQITESIPNRQLAFDILRQPRYPEIFDHATIKSGSFDLVDNRNGTTTLYGTTTYNLHVFPGAYFDLWAKLIGSNVHMRVIEHIKKECEGR